MTVAEPIRSVGGILTGQPVALPASAVGVRPEDMFNAPAPHA